MNFASAFCLAVAFVIVCPEGTVGVGQYSRIASYEDELVLRCPDKTKPTVQTLRSYADVWQVGTQSIDLRLEWRAFTAVKSYFPECWVVIRNVEEHVRLAEAAMFPARKDQEESWVQEVMEEVEPGKPLDLAACEEELGKAETRFMASNVWFQEYHDYEGIRQWYEHLASCHPDLVRYVPSIGQSVQGRDMPAVHITAAGDKSDRHRIYFQCLIHAREWISGAVCMYIANHLVKNYGDSDEVTALLDSLEFIIVPIVNPDGYVNSWSKDRLWRKNMASCPDDCVGVDLNRNFPQGWREAGRASYQACLEDYGGTNTCSEPETQNIIDYFRRHAPIVGAIDWHSHGQLILRPWGWTSKPTENDVRLESLGKEMSDAIQKVNDQTYISKASYDLYQCFGIATDWFYSDNATKTNQGYRPAAFVVELRDRGVMNGGYGFLLPSNQIIPTGEEVVPAALHFARSLLDNPIVYQEASVSSQENWPSDFDPK